MRIFRLKKDWHSSISNGRIGFMVFHAKGDLFFEELQDIGTQYEKPFYHPFKGGYPVLERADFKFLDEYFEFVEETGHPKEYFIEKKYTEHDMQAAIQKVKP
jgi:hypothetical protein